MGWSDALRSADQPEAEAPAACAGTKAEIVPASRQRRPRRAGCRPGARDRAHPDHQAGPAAGRRQGGVGRTSGPGHRRQQDHPWKRRCLYHLRPPVGLGQMAVMSQGQAGQIVLTQPGGETTDLDRFQDGGRAGGRPGPAAQHRQDRKIVRSRVRSSQRHSADGKPVTQPAGAVESALHRRDWTGSISPRQALRGPGQPTRLPQGRTSARGRHQR